MKQPAPLQMNIKKQEQSHQLFGLSEPLRLLDKYPLNYFGHLSAFVFHYLGPNPAPAYACAPICVLWSSTKESSLPASLVQPICSPFKSVLWMQPRRILARGTSLQIMLLPWSVLKVFTLFPRDSPPLNCKETVLLTADAIKGTQINYMGLSSFYIQNKIVLWKLLPAWSLQTDCKNTGREKRASMDRQKDTSNYRNPHRSPCSFLHNQVYLAFELINFQFSKALKHASSPINISRVSQIFKVKCFGQIRA